ncbi:MAG TPA: hypothetical protein VFH56_03200 [Acidimicrobiales bacterium]|nr:hypothetical protein [Acidimicrobiales bacterium]
MGSRHLRLFVCVIVLLAAVPALLGRSIVRADTAAAPASSCPDSRAPILVLSAMPLEAAPVLARAHVDPAPAWVDPDGKGFWEGSLAGNSVVIAITGIGIANATRTTQAAYDHFKCFSLVVFSGTSGGDHIGDVMVPAHWTQDGKTFIDTDSTALNLVDQLATDPPALEQSTPVGDPLCNCASAAMPEVTAPVTVQYKPVIEPGGYGASNDGFGGRALPCTPAVNDVAGCWPCKFPDTAVAAQAQYLAQTAPPFVDPSFFLDYETASAPPPPPPGATYASDDMETAATFQVAANHGTPVIGFRAASDGGGDPLHLPGFPAQFFVYRQLAADNAATTAVAFLAAWRQSQQLSPA